jgi:glucokinase
MDTPEGPMGKKDLFIGIDLGATKILAAVFDKRFKVLGRARKKTKASEGTTAVLGRIRLCVEEAVAEARVPMKKIRALGIGCPGPVDMQRGIIHQAPNLGWKDVHLRERLYKFFRRPVFVLNDVDAGIYGEYRFGAARGARCAVGIFPGTGIGGGCVYKDDILSGATHSCFEIGHIPLLPEGPLCGCGQRGCLEALASRLAVSAAAAAAAYRGEAPRLFSIGGTDISEYGSGSLAEAVKAGDKAVKKILRQAAVWIGRGAAIAVNLLAPDMIVLGGGMVEAMPDLFRREAMESARAACLPAFRNSFRMTVAELGDDAAIRGAAAWAERSVRGEE